MQYALTEIDTESYKSLLQYHTTEFDLTLFMFVSIKLLAFVSINYDSTL